MLKKQYTGSAGKKQENYCFNDSPDAGKRNKATEDTEDTEIQIII
jgi:hypothetical protein